MLFKNNVTKTVIEAYNQRATSYSFNGTSKPILNNNYTTLKGIKQFMQLSPTRISLKNFLVVRKYKTREEKYFI